MISEAQLTPHCEMIKALLGVLVYSFYFRVSLIMLTVISETCHWKLSPSITFGIWCILEWSKKYTGMIKVHRMLPHAFMSGLAFQCRFSANFSNHDHIWARFKYQDGLNKKMLIGFWILQRKWRAYFGSNGKRIVMELNCS